jgi:predicted MarR family transcription regulator
MKVRELKNALTLMTDEKNIDNSLTKISHWISKLNNEKRIETAIFQEIHALQNLEKLGLVDIESRGVEVTAKLTASGRELYRDFLGKGYYLK